MDTSFMDRLFEVRLPGGRAVRVTALSIRPAYENILEGTPGPRVDPVARDYQEGRAQGLGEPLVVLEPPRVPLLAGVRDLDRMARCAVAARLQSAPLDPEQSWSQLTLLWWVEALDRPLPELVAEALAGVSWEANAKDFYFW